jgi:O-antigen/teichoic acid export membrane protein
MPETSRTKKVLALSLGNTFNTIAFIVAGMVAARVLSKHDYATWKQTFLIYELAAPLLLLGLPSAVYYFLPMEQERKKGVIIDNLTLITAMASLFSLFLFLGGAEYIAGRFENETLRTTMGWMVLYPLYVMPAAILGAVMIVQSRTNELTLYNVITNFILAASIIISVYMTQSYSGPLLVQIIYPLILLPITIWLMFRYIPGTLSKPDFTSMRAMLKYSVPLGLAGMLGVLMLQTNKIIVSAMCTPEEFAEYINGAIEIPLIGVVTGSIASVILVDMVKYIHEGDKPRALELFKKAASKSALILFPVMIFLLIAGKPFIVTLYSEKYLQSVVPFYIYLFVLPIRIVVYGSAMMALGMSKIILFRSIFDLAVNAVLSILFIMAFGYLGAAVATVVTLYLWTVPFNLRKISQGFDVRIAETLPIADLGRIMAISIAASPPAALYVWMSGHDYVIRFVVSSVLYGVPALYLLGKYGYIDFARIGFLGRWINRR